MSRLTYIHRAEIYDYRAGHHVCLNPYFSHIPHCSAFFQKVLTFIPEHVIILKHCENAGVAQLVEQLICNQQVGGSSPSASSMYNLK
jgi:hypothetical protein